jgi:predicted nucleic acid-binding protein
MKVVANAGPLIALGKLGLVYLLHSVYGTVQIPSVVYEEVVTDAVEFERPDAYAVQLAVARQELTVVNMDDAELSEAIRALPLHRGEKHAIQLGLKEAADWVLLDDQLARDCALRLGLKVKGTLGVIVATYRSGLMTFLEIELILQAALDREDIWIHHTLVRRILDQLRQEG